MTADTQVVIIRHATEAILTSNSGRLAHMALPNSLLLSHGSWEKQRSGPNLGQVRSSKVDQSQIDCEDGLLLYGAATASGPPRLPFKPRRLVVLDASYRQARRMYKQIEVLRGLPELCLQAPVATVERLRQAPDPGGMATLEAIAHALDMLEGPAIGQPLHRLYAEFVRRTRTQRGYPSRRVVQSLT